MLKSKKRLKPKDGSIIENRSKTREQYYLKCYSSSIILEILLCLDEIRSELNYIGADANVQNEIRANLEECFDAFFQHPNETLLEHLTEYLFGKPAYCD